MVGWSLLPGTDFAAHAGAWRSLNAARGNSLLLDPEVISACLTAFGGGRERLAILGAHRLGRWAPSIHLIGRDILEQARKEGRGAVLWTSFSTFGGIMVKKALADRGLPLVTLRSYRHPYSASRFGLRILNPIQTRIEDRYITRAVTLYPERDIIALRELMQCLKENALIEIAANSDSSNPIKRPFMGGTLRLALGAPTLARLCSTPLVPVFTRITEEKDFEVMIEPPLELPEALGDQTAEENLAGRYIEFLERHLRSCPIVWRGWLSQSLWSADGTERKSQSQA